MGSNRNVQASTTARGGLFALCAAIALFSTLAGAQDPDDLNFSTYHGGTGGDWAAAMRTSPNGNIVATGYTESADFPLVNEIDDTLQGTSDGFIVVFDPNGDVITSTYFGGNGSYEEINAIAFDAAANVYLLLTTDSSDISGTDGSLPQGGRDVMVLVMNPDCTQILQSTRIGGPANDETWASSTIIVNASNEVYIAFFGSAGLPATTGSNGGNQDCVIAKLNSNLSINFLTYVGGDHRDQSLGMVVADTGEIWFTGRTRSSNFPTVNAQYPNHAGGTFWDGFIACLNSTGTALLYSSHVGGTANELLYGLALTSTQVILLGQTASTDFPMPLGDVLQPNSAGGNEIVVLKFNRGTGYLEEGTFVGGAGNDLSENHPYLDGDGNIWFAAYTNSTLYPTTPGAYSANYKGGLWDSALTGISADLKTLVYSTFIGGSDADHGTYLDKGPGADFYLLTGSSTSADFPVTTSVPFKSGTSGHGVASPYGDFVLSSISTSPPGDADSDGLPDWWEEQYALNTSINDAAFDPDTDGLTNMQEFQNQTNPKQADPDADGLNDGQEVALTTNPFSADTDKDGLSDNDEVRDLDPATSGLQNPFDPLVADSTGDNFSDAADTVNDGMNDYDNDGNSNATEIRDKTNPLDPNSRVAHPALSYTLGTSTPIATFGPDGDGTDYVLNWSPDGSKIGVVQYQAGNYYDPNTVAYSVPADGSAAPQTLNLLPHAGPLFAWGRDGISWWYSRPYPASGLLQVRLLDQETMQFLRITGIPLAPSFTSRTGVNYMTYVRVEVADPNNVQALRVDAAGQVEAQPYNLTSFTPDPAITVPSFSRNGNKVAFGTGSFSGYVLHGALDILNGVAGAPTDLSDPRIVSLGIGASLTGISSFSYDGEAVFFSLDTVGTESDPLLINYSNTDFDIAFAPAAGGAPTVFSRTGDQTQAQISPSGSRIAYLDNSSGNWELYVANLTASAPVSEGVTTETVQVTDVSETKVTIDAGTTVTFPDGEPEVISISTPITPVQPAQIPEGASGIPVTREFGPPGTTFNPAAVITITYTDEEVEGLTEEEELELQIYQYNELSGIFDLPVEEDQIVERDVVNNTITFEVQHFSVYGLVIGEALTMPALHPVALLLLLTMVAGLGALLLGGRRRALRQSSR